MLSNIADKVIFCSGKLRELSKASTFTRIRGYVSTVRKQGKNALDCIKSTFTVNPFDPTFA